MDYINGKLKGVSSVNDLIKLVEELKLTKQDTLIDQLNIKTINGQSILGRGNLEIAGVIDYYLKKAIVEDDYTLVITDVYDQEIVRYTPITQEDKDNLAKLGEVINRISQVEDRLDTIEDKVDNIKFYETELDYFNENKEIID